MNSTEEVKVVKFDHSKSILECGRIGSVEYNGKLYDLKLCRDTLPIYTFSLDMMLGRERIASLDAGNGLFEHTASASGRWIGLSTLCWYSHSTEYYLYDMSVTTDRSIDDDGYICIGGEVFGASKKFQVDYEMEHVIWNSGKMLSFEEMKESEDHLHFK